MPLASRKLLPLCIPLLSELPVEMLSLGEEMLHFCGEAVTARTVNV